jgi:hypothetical protein
VQTSLVKESTTALRSPKSVPYSVANIPIYGRREDVGAGWILLVVGTERERRLLVVKIPLVSLVPLQYMTQ